MLARFFFSVCAILLFAVTELSALQISFFTGDVKVIRNGTALPKVNVGTKLSENDVVKTGNQSMVSMSYDDGSEIRMKPMTTLKIGKTTGAFDNAPAVVIAGAVITKFEKLSKDMEPRKVYTPTAVCAVRGTEFSVYVSDGAATRIDLSEGNLDVHNPYGGQNIAAGQNLETRVASAPAALPSDTGSSDDWKEKEDTALSSNAADASKQFKNYLGDFASRGSQNKSSISSVNGDVRKAKSEDDLNKSTEVIEVIRKTAEEEMYLSDATAEAISSIMDRFEKEKNQMYSDFIKLKSESNKVKEQQKRNYEAIEAVRESYKKAREEILKQQEDNVRKIKESTDLNSVQPPAN